MLNETLLDCLDDLCRAMLFQATNTLASEIAREASSYADEAGTDTLGNVIAHVRGDRPRVMVTVHLDEIGFMIPHIDERGFLFFASAGGHRVQNLFARACTTKTENGRLVPSLIDHMRPGRLQGIQSLLKLDEFFIDVGVSSMEEAKRMGLEIGNIVSLDY